MPPLRRSYRVRAAAVHSRNQAEGGTAQDKSADIATIDMRVVYENRWMRVREDRVRRRDGSGGIYGIVEKPDFVVIVPVEEGGRLHLVQQYRYPVYARYWEFPQGSWEQTADADPLDVARGELREETGLTADRMIHVGHLFEAMDTPTRAITSFSPLACGAARPPPSRRSKIS